MKTLKDILAFSKVEQTIGNLEQFISKIELDSRSCEPDSLFVAIKGHQVDGHLFIEKAIENGAQAIICEELPKNYQESVTYVQVADSQKVLAEAAAAFYDFPSRKIKMIGITGTNGKTTTSTLLFDLFNGLGLKSGLISTIEYKIGENSYTSTHTTPNAIRVQELLAEMVAANCLYCFMEVSSHALDQKRVWRVDYDLAIFSNISRDHLDYHPDYNHYIASKKLLFDHLKEDAYALVNKDDKHGETMLLHTKAKAYTYSLKGMADFKTKIIETDLQGSLINLNDIEAYVQLIGRHNIYNTTVCFAVASLMGLDIIDTVRLLTTLAPAKGRFQQIYGPENRIGIVDYAHTPDALENILKSISEIKYESSQIITVVGCGGDRDKGKRPQMAKIACQYSHQVILTSDNPRSEDPDTIITDMEKGIPPQDVGKVLSITQRDQAIKTALRLSKPKDVILVAGKGHETYQEINGKKHHFDDAEEIQKNFILIPQN
ncbi:MAG: UDP-N-acetylmuramoyl-L-alanyl-D-glutamate--2,6-diaminopimelate ligase [Flavobacteriales bacterium]|nr:UDP-N-acetylmuramoyl-L-alanyl-D-glutamate--2,6-diaminopimelate ligase [Flavobacteriales bacterium]